MFIRRPFRLLEINRFCFCFIRLMREWMMFTCNGNGGETTNKKENTVKKIYITTEYIAPHAFFCCTFREIAHCETSFLLFDSYASSRSAFFCFVFIAYIHGSQWPNKPRKNAIDFIALTILPCVLARIELLSPLIFRLYHETAAPD